jgi:DNA mismatch repair protein MutS
MATSPMMQQYMDAKNACGDALLLFRMGDFYELFYEDAKIAAECLGLTLTSRDKGDNPIPMAGFPHHQLDGYLAKIITSGRRAAVCEQVEDPKKAKGLVKREVTRVVSPGTLTDDSLLDPRESNFLAAVAFDSRTGGESQVGIAWAELSTGRFTAAVFPTHQLADELTRVGPSECLLADEAADLPAHLVDDVMVTRRPNWAFALDTAEANLLQHFEIASLAGFGFKEEDGLAVRAAGAVLDYLKETQKSSLKHFHRLLPYQVGHFLEIDEATRRSLEIARTMRHGHRDGSLLSVIDRTMTAMGSRLLADWIAGPLTDRPALEARLDAVDELVQKATLREELRLRLREIYDIERLLARVMTGRASPRDLSFIGRTLGQLPALKQLLADSRCARLVDLEQALDACPEIQQQLAAALVDNCPIPLREGGIIRPGYHEELDSYRELATGGKRWIAEYQAQESERIDIPNLKVGFNRVFGYYIEITHAHQDRVPETYIRKQTLKNAERYITPELKEYEERVLSADDKAKELEYELFLQLRDLVQSVAHRLQQSAEALAAIDVLAGLAELASHHNYCRPQLVDEPILDIKEGRHPVLDIIEPQGTFVPNDSQVGLDTDRILLITGPNMAGKSTYIRQVADES